MPPEHPAPRRVIYFDVLRVLATFAVIVLHLSAQHWADTDVFSNAWLAFNLYGGIVRWSVPIFVMISGALFLGRDTDIHTILKRTSHASPRSFSPGRAATRSSASSFATRRFRSCFRSSSRGIIISGFST